MNKNEKDAFLACRKYISENNKEKALLYLDKIVSYWHVPREFGKDPNEILEIIKPILSIQEKIIIDFNQKLQKLLHGS